MDVISTQRPGSRTPIGRMADVTAPTRTATFQVRVVDARFAEVFDGEYQVGVLDRQRFIFELQKATPSAAPAESDLPMVYHNSIPEGRSGFWVMYLRLDP